MKTMSTSLTLFNPNSCILQLKCRLISFCSCRPTGVMYIFYFLSDNDELAQVEKELVRKLLDLDACVNWLRCIYKCYFSFN